MSGIYIPGMEIPKEKGSHEIKITLFVREDGTAGLWGTETYIPHEPLTLIPVPNHGRLGDLDELKECLKKPVTMDANKAERLWVGWHECTIGVWQAIDALPTIIPADPEEEIE